MAARYWVGGNDNWNGTAGSKWATSSGGAGGAAVPTAADDVFLDGNSGNVTITANVACRSLNCTGYGGTLTHGYVTCSIGDGTAGAGNVALKLAGAGYTHQSNTTSVWNFVSTSGTQQTIDFGGFEQCSATFNGTGGSWIFQSSATFTWAFTLTAGALNTAGYGITMNLGLFSITGTGTRSLTLETTTITSHCPYDGAFDATTTTNLTFSGASSTLVFDAADDKTVLRGGGLSYGTVNITGTGTKTISGSNTFVNLTRSNAAACTLTLPAGVTQTITGTFQASGTAGNVVTLQSSSAGSAATLSKASGVVACDYMSVKDSTATGGASWYAGRNSTDVSGNSGWLFVAYSSAGAALAGSGTLTSAGVRTVTGDAQLSGTGTLATAGVLTTLATAALSGTGTLVSTGYGTSTTDAQLSGTGTLATAGVRTTFATAALSGSGTLAATGVTPGGATLTGTGTLATAGVRTTLATAALTGSGTLDGSGHRDVAAQAALSGSGTLAATPSGMSAYSDAVVNDGATTYLRFGETSGTTAADAVGSNAHTYQGSPTLGASSLLGGDSANKAVTLNGSSQYVSNGSPGSALDVGDTFTVECWLKRGGTGTQQDIWGRDYGGGQIIRISSGNAIVLRKSGIANIVTSTTTITDTSTAHHIVVTKSGSTVKIYIDGADVTGSVSNQTFGSVSGASVIARDASSSSGYLNGTLDEFAVYKNVALTSTQVADHYDLGTRIRGAAALSGTGTLTATASTAGTQTGAAALSGTGDLTSAGTVTRLGGAALSGSGALAGAGTRTTSGGAGLTGSGTLATAGIRTRSSDAALSGSGTLATAGTVTPGATYGAALTGTGLLATAGVRTRFGEVTLFGTGNLAATGFRSFDGSASLSGTGVLGADGYATVTAGAGLLGTGVLASAVAGKIARLAVSTSAIDVGLADESIDVGLGSSESARVTVGVS